MAPVPAPRVPPVISPPQGGRLTKQVSACLGPGIPPACSAGRHCGLRVSWWAPTASLAVLHPLFPQPALQLALTYFCSLNTPRSLLSEPPLVIFLPLGIDFPFPLTTFYWLPPAHFSVPNLKIHILQEAFPFPLKKTEQNTPKMGIRPPLHSNNPLYLHTLCYLCLFSYLPYLHLRGRLLSMQCRAQGLHPAAFAKGIGQPDLMGGNLKEMISNETIFLCWEQPMEREGAQRDIWDHGGFLYLALVEVTWGWT